MLNVTLISPLCPLKIDMAFKITIITNLTVILKVTSILVGVDKISDYRLPPTYRLPTNFGSVVGIKFCSERQFGTEPN
jgi:hypothetical protein